MNRREALVLMGTVVGGTIFGADRMLASLANALEGTSKRLFSADDLRLLDEIAETIIPATADSGGAKAARIGEFMQEIVGDFYTDAERAVFTEGLQEFRPPRGPSKSGAHFLEMSAPEREAMLLGLERSKPIPDYYRMIKQLTVWGYFSSEIGATQALAHVAVPGRFQGCVTIESGTKAWSD